MTTPAEAGVVFGVLAIEDFGLPYYTNTINTQCQINRPFFSKNF